MKLLKSLFALAVLSGGLTTTTQAQEAPKETPKVVAVINRADWCAVCKANGARVGGLVPTYVGKPVVFVPNDLTNATTKAASAKDLTKLGVLHAVAPVRETGVLVLVNYKTHQLIKTISVAQPNEKLEEAISSAIVMK